MRFFFHNFLWCFIPLFVAIDTGGLLPLYTGMVQDFSERQKRIIILHSLTTALGVSTGFILLGNVIFGVLAITVADFQIAGGLVLVVLGIVDLISEEKVRRRPADTMGIVPLGVPLIVGPAVLSISLHLLQRYGLGYTLLSLIANLFIVGVAFRFSSILLRIFGKGGAAALSKIFTLLLVAIAVRMIRSGIMELLQEAGN